MRARITSAALVASPTFHPQESRLDYRNRVRLQVAPEGKLSFFNSHKSEACAVLRSDLVNTLRELRLLSLEDPDIFAPFAHAELRAADLDGNSGLLLSPKNLNWNDEDASTWEERARPRLPHKLLLDYRIPKGSGGRKGFATTLSRATCTQRFSLNENTYQRVPLNGFIQVNPEINQALVARVVDLALEAGASRALDLYCGSGNFLLPLAAAGQEVSGVELNPDSVASAKIAAREQDLSVEVFSGTVDDWLRSQEGQFGAELVIADPPRAGLQEALGPLLKLAPRHILLCSCNAESLMFDLRSLTLGGYRIRTMRHVRPHQSRRDRRPDGAIIPKVKREMLCTAPLSIPLMNTLSLTRCS